MNVMRGQLPMLSTQPVGARATETTYQQLVIIASFDTSFSTMVPGLLSWHLPLWLVHHSG